jgi:hypothetical protein
LSTFAFGLILMLLDIEAPLVGRPEEHFHGAVGEHVRVELSASPTEVLVEQPFVLTLTILGADNPERIERPDLQRFPEFGTRFHIEDIRDDGLMTGKRVFQYRLRARNELVRDVPPLFFH